jgi:hypothetical protein
METYQDLWQLSGYPSAQRVSIGILEAIKKAQESDARFKAYNKSPIGIYITDSKMEIVASNETWLEMAEMHQLGALGKG